MTVWSAGSEVRADPQRHGDLDGGEDGQGDGHGRDGAPDQRPGGDAEGEGERGVAERGDAVGGEVQLAEPALATPLPEPSATAWLIGAAHQVCMRLSLR